MLLKRCTSAAEMLGQLMELESEISRLEQRAQSLKEQLTVS